MRSQAGATLPQWSWWSGSVGGETARRLARGRSASGAWRQPSTAPSGPGQGADEGEFSDDGGRDSPPLWDSYWPPGDNDGGGDAAGRSSRPSRGRTSAPRATMPRRGVSFGADLAPAGEPAAELASMLVYSAPRLQPGDAPGITRPREQQRRAATIHGAPGGSN